MKQYAIVILAVLGIGYPLVATAQSSGGGIKAGVAFSTIPKIDEEFGVGTTKARTGLTVGMFFTRLITPAIGIQPEVLFTQKGTKYSIAQIAGAEDVVFQVDYLEVPILLRGNLGTGPTRGYVLAGPSFNFNVRSRVRSTFAGVTSEEDISQNTKKFELALTLAGGVEFGKLLVEGRFSEGLTNLAKDEPDINIKHRTFSVLAGVRF